MNKFRYLKADEIECRIGNTKKDKEGNITGFSLLLYKDARVDQRLLDETVGPLNWQKHYSRDNANCTVAIWDEEKNQWIEKEDTGTESNTEELKGLASDSFKRACFCWGIGRELYTAPFIWVTGKDKYDKFKVLDIGYDEVGNIRILTIIDAKTKEVVFTTEKTTAARKKPAKTEEEVKTDAAIEEAKLRTAILGYVNRHSFTPENIQMLCKRYGVKGINELSAESCKHYINFVEKHGGNINE